MKSPVHPGAFIKHEIIEPLGLNFIAAAQILAVDQSILSALLNEHTALRSDVALRIEKAFGVSKDTLMRMQKSHDTAKMADGLK
ncbi:HigA family addiction module antitoxin [Orrella sp. 11846]|uniref:HigA family addiction module antitoxin n=1 Tax=Orrella sp. 11846 TaxID=3409913 RepID=UPI003B5C090D